MEFLILAISYKYTGLCVAGIDLNTLEFVRIGHTINNSNECAPIALNELNFNGTLLKIRDVIDIDVKKMRVNGCQTENYTFIIKINYGLALYCQVYQFFICFFSYILFILAKKNLVELGILLFAWLPQ